jgi:hypothetical protein
VKEREEIHAKRETTDSAQKEPNDEHARSAVEFVLEHGASCCTAFTNNTRLRSFMFKHMHIKYIYYATYASTK